MRTRWLVLSMIVAVAAVGTLAYWNERGRSDAEIADFGDEQASVAEAAALALGPAPDAATARRVLAPLEHLGRVRVLVAAPGGPAQTLDGQTPGLPVLADAIARGDRFVVM